jgi:hypothetical protein
VQVLQQQDNTRGTMVFVVIRLEKIAGIPHKTPTRIKSFHTDLVIICFAFLLLFELDKINHAVNRVAGFAEYWRQ